MYIIKKNNIGLYITFYNIYFKTIFIYLKKLDINIKLQI